MTDTNARRQDQVLPPGTYQYMQDVTSGIIKTYTGPTVVNPSAQETPIVYDEAAGTFRPVLTSAEAVKKAIIGVEGYYVVLLNPAKDNQHPQDGKVQQSVALDVGRKINIPGPTMFSLWPGQAADVIRGHQLRSNEYLIVRVYNEEEARRNWGKAIIKKATTGTGEGSGEGGDKTDTKTEVTETSPLPENMTVGTQFIIKGTEVSFYIPPTGVSVCKDEENGSFVRKALTLELLEYSILIDENGNKRYEKGPQVVFPKPTERFYETQEDGKGEKTKKFRAVELNEIQGLHLKVIAPYKDGKREYREGEELFITGKDTAIYYPREEHSAIRYDGKTKHFATAVPAGEGRYVMNRMNGEIKLAKGPNMLLPDPRSEVIVRRVLSERQTSLWYPGNREVEEYNRNLRDLLGSSPTTRAGAISEGDVQRRYGNERVGGSSKGLMRGAVNAVMESSQVSREQNVVGQEFSYSSSYTQPRTLTLDTKFQGAPNIEIWPGYAVMVVSKQGKRRVEKGPTNVLLEYDETLEVIELSMGKPKTTDHLKRDVYLQVENNKVSDVIEVETADHVRIDVKLSHLVNFEGDSTRWFTVSNYVKLLCDRVRSVLKGKVRKLRAEEFYGRSTEIIRDTILGESKDGVRTGMAFEANGMRVTDVDVLSVTLKDERIRALLDQSQHEVVRSNIELSTLQRGLDMTRQREDISKTEAELRAATKHRHNELSVELATSDLMVTMASLAHMLEEVEKKKEVEQAQADVEAFKHDARLALSKRTRDQEVAFAAEEQARKIAFLKAEAETTVQRFAAIQGGLSEALLALSNNETLAKLGAALNIQTILGGKSVSEAARNVFKGTTLEGVVDKALATVSNGKSVTQQPTVS